MVFVILIVFLISMFLNTLIRRLHSKYVTVKWPLIGVERGFPGEAGIVVGEKLK